MPYTKYAKDAFVNIDIRNLKNIKLIKSSIRPNICKCENYIYNGQYGCVSIYIKETINKDANNNTLVYSNNELLLGFKGKKLI